jgi:hypothetical protein
MRPDREKKERSEPEAFTRLSAAGRPPLILR